MVQQEIMKALEEATGQTNIQFGFSDRSEHGDYTSNVAMRLGGNPRENALEIIKKLEQNRGLKKIVSNIEIAGPGFINFFLHPEVVISELKNALTQNTEYGKNSSGRGKKIIVEYSSPNIAKPFSIGHFRSTIIGDSIANLLAAEGYEVLRDNHLGDWGTQFGKQIYAIKAWGNEMEIEKSENPVKELVSLYVKFHEEAEKNPELEEEARKWFKKLEDHDPEATALWQKCIDWSWVEFEKIYKQLGITFTENNGRGYGESYFEGKMQEVLDELNNKKLLTVGENGAQLVFFENEKYPPLMILKKDGATLYSTRDLAADKWRLSTYGKDTTIINEVGADQALYFRQLYELEKMLAWVSEAQRIHIKHGLFRFKDKKMSTRKGNVIWLEDVINTALTKATQLMAVSGERRSEFGEPDELLNRKLELDKTLSNGSRNDDIEKISIGALKWNELKRDPVGDIVFDWDEILNMKGNSGPYLQYTVVRIESVVKKLGKDIPKVESLSESDTALARTVIKFPEVVSMAAMKYQPSYVAEYLYTLASEFNTFYDTNRILGNEKEAEYVAISKAVSVVLTNGLSLLGIQVPEKM